MCVLYVWGSKQPYWHVYGIVEPICWLYFAQFDCGPKNVGSEICHIFLTLFCTDAVFSHSVQRPVIYFQVLTRTDELLALKNYNLSC